MANMIWIVEDYRVDQYSGHEWDVDKSRMVEYFRSEAKELLDEQAAYSYQRPDEGTVGSVTLFEVEVSEFDPMNRDDIVRVNNYVQDVLAPEDFYRQDGCKAIAGVAIANGTILAEYDNIR